MSMFAVLEAPADSGKVKSTSTSASADVRGEASMGAIAMSIVHDLRNPLAAIHSGAEMLHGSEVPEHQVRRLARNMYNASVRIQELLQDYVELCRSRESRPQLSHLRSLIGDAADRIATAAEAQAVVVTQDVPGDLTVAVDRRRIGSVLANLLANALEAMPAGGSIHISAAAEKSGVVVRVADSGPGIAPEIRDCLFEPFITARKPEGWGLGLAQARQVVMDYGGDMWLDSPPGRGACLAFSLPGSVVQPT